MAPAAVAFARNDARSVRRDSLMVGVLVAPWVIALVLRAAVPPVSDLLTARDLEIATYYPIVAVFFLVLNVPLLLGVVTGFLGLDERDDDTLTALRVTPASLTGFLAYRLGVAAAASALVTVAALPLSGLAQPADLPRLAPAVLLASLFAPFVTLLLLAFAANKLEGFAVTKGFGLLVLGPVAAYLVPGNWEYAFAALPTYWPAAAYWRLAEGDPAGLHLLVGLGYLAAVLVLLYRRTVARVVR